MKREGKVMGEVIYENTRMPPRSKHEMGYSQSMEFLHKSSVTHSESDWEFNTLRAANDSDYFHMFRSTPTFRRVVEGTTYLDGLMLLKRNLRRPLFGLVIQEIAKSEFYGSPHDLVELHYRGSTYLLSPTTLRYVNNTLNMYEIFGPNIFNLHIIEVGAGYGGEQKIFFDFARHISTDHLPSYQIYDLPTSIPLIEKYLALYGLKPQIGNYEVLENSSIFLTEISGEENILVISNGALSEMRGKVLDVYLETIVRKAKYGYFITNFETHSKPFPGGISTSEFVKRLSDFGKDVKVMSASKYLSPGDAASGSRLIVFGDLRLDRIIQNSSFDITRYKLLKPWTKIQQLITSFMLAGSKF